MIDKIVNFNNICVHARISVLPSDWERADLFQLQIRTINFEFCCTVNFNYCTSKKKFIYWNCFFGILSSKDSPQ